MNGHIYKEVSSITKEEILQVCEYVDAPKYGDIMNYKKFVKYVEEYYITDYDGSGELMLFGKVVKNTSTWCHNRTVFFSGKFFVPFDVLYSIFGDDVKFIWFNK